MLEILILIFLCRKIGDKAILKGLPPGRWKLYTVLTWFGCEIAGLFLGMIISGNMLAAVALGLVSAFGGYLLVRHSLDKYPDQSGSNWIDEIGKQ